MQAAADQSPGAMLSVLGLELPQVEELVAQARGDDVLQVANLLCPNNYAVSGHRAACDRLAAKAEAARAKVARLAVAGAFHTPLMQPAADALAGVLAGATLAPPRVPVWFNVTGRPHADPGEFPALLRRQVVEPVRWEETMRGLLAEGFDRFYEIGPGRVLTGLLKRVQRKVDIRSVGA
jgi:[acyl-carrier-protein] S-malonyltransferase